MSTRRENENEGGVGGVRRDGDGMQQAVITGYRDATGKPRQNPGDEIFPFVKDPPAIELAVQLRSNALAGAVPFIVVGPPVVGFETTLEIETLGYRLLEVFLEYTPGTSAPGVGAGVLCLIAQKKLTLPNFTTGVAWVAQGVVDPTLNLPGISPGFSFRRFYESELRLQPYNGLTPPFPAPTARFLTLTFDVSTAVAWRFLLGDLVAGDPQVGTGTPSRLNLWYQLQR